MLSGKYDVVCLRLYILQDACLVVKLKKKDSFFGFHEVKLTLVCFNIFTISGEKG